MEEADRKILEHQLAKPVAKAVSKWMKENGIEEPVFVNATVSNPSCYVDEQGVSHTGPLVVCDVRIADMDEDEDDDDY